MLQDRIRPGAPVEHVAVRPGDFPGLKPEVLVQVGERVRLGQPLVRDRDRRDVMLGSPAAGVVQAIHRGERRALQSVVVAIDHDVDGSAERGEAFPRHTRDEVERLSRSELLALLRASGLLASFRTRPFGRVPDFEAAPPQALFASAPADADAGEAFEAGLVALTRLCDGPVFLCRGRADGAPHVEPARVRAVRSRDASRPELVGTAIARHWPVFHDGRVVTIGAQETTDLGALLLEGRLRTDRLVAVVGPLAVRPGLLRTRRGASLTELLAAEASGPDPRIVSGWPACRDAVTEATAFLGAFDAEVALHAKAVPARREARPLVLPLPVYDRALPMPVPTVPLLRALLAGDLEEADRHGVRGLLEEDLARCTEVCPSGHDYGRALRRVLDALAEGP